VSARPRGRGRHAVLVAVVAGALASGCGGVIHGRVFVDLDGDRVRDANEPGVPGVAVFFERAVRTRADASGDYILATPYPLGVVWAWTPDGYRPGPSYAHVLDEDAEVDIPIEPAAAAAAAGSPWTFAVGTDTHLVTPNPGERWTGGDVGAALAQLLAPAPTPPRFFTLLGDLTQATRGSELDQLDAILAPIRVPFVAVAGNHDFYDGGVAWRQRWGPDGYAFDTGGIRVVVWNAFLPDALQLDFLHLVLDGEDPGAPIVALGHASPRDAVATAMAALGIDTLFTGHWHANRRVDRFGLVEWGTEPLTMGGLDHTPAGYRVVTVDAGRLTTTERSTLLAPVLDLAAPRTCAGPGAVDVIAVAAIDAGAPVVTAAWADASTRPPPAATIGSAWTRAATATASSPARSAAATSSLAPVGGWAYRGQLEPLGGQPRTLILTATSPGGLRHERRDLIVPCPTRGSGSARTGRWSQLQGGPTHLGATIASIGDLAPAWTTAIGGHVLGGSPIVTGDAVYLTVSDLGDGTHGGVVALELATGRERWRVGTSRPARSAVAVDHGIVVIADTGGMVRAVSARSGHEKWRRDFSRGTDSWTWHLWQAPTIADGVVYIGTQAQLAAFDLVTGARRWMATFDRPRPWLGSTAAASVVGDRVLFIPDREDGVWLGDRATGAAVAAIESEDFVGIAGAPAVTADAIYIGNSHGEVLALSPVGLGVIWRTALVVGGNDWSESIVGNLAVADGRVFAPTQAGELVALDAATGAIEWRHGTAAGPIDAVHYASDGVGYAASPVVTGDRVWLGGPDGELRAFAVATGRELEHHALGSPILGGVAPVDGGLVVATFGGTVHLLAPAPASPRPFPWIVFPLGLAAFLVGVGAHRRARYRRRR